MRTYEELKGHPADFIVSYHLYAPSEGGRKVTFQHLRCDFSYDGYDIATDGIFMIYPEFLGKDGQPIKEGIRIKIGTRGYFMEGGRKVGSLEVVQVVDLHVNPIS